MTEQVYAIPRESVLDNIGKILELKDAECGTFFDRDLAEKDERILQLIPYCLVTDGERILSYYRTKHCGEERLRGNLSLGFGGHINPVDQKEGQSLVYSCSVRELEEEINLTNIKSLTPVTWIYDPSNEVGRVHLGVAIICLISPEEYDRCTNKCDSVDIVSTTPSEVIENLDKYEGWSKIFIASHGMNFISPGWKRNDF